MFSILSKKKNIELYSPVTGEMIPIEQVKDGVFSGKLLGDGVAFKPEQGVIVSPCNGFLKVIFPTLHAFAIKADSGLEIIVHIGLDTVNLKGSGFKKLAEVNQRVRIGDPIIDVDLDLMKKKNIDITTPMVITESNGYTIDIKNSEKVTGGQDIVIVCNKK